MGSSSLNVVAIWNGSSDAPTAAVRTNVRGAIAQVSRPPGGVYVAIGYVFSGFRSESWSLMTSMPGTIMPGMTRCVSCFLQMGCRVT